MQSSLPASPLSGLTILQARHEYRSCHIELPDSTECVAAIQVNSDYYSFFQFQKEQKRALELAQKLLQRGYRVALTQASKGYALWVLEANARIVQRKPRSGFSQEAAATAPSYKLLSASHQYRPCHIQVPDLDKRLAAIEHETRFYSLFKAVADMQEANQLIRRLANRGDGAVVTPTAKGFAIWIEEPEGRLA